jgi:hypothetical protein
MAGRGKATLKRPASGRFNEFIRGQLPATGKLPLVHVSRGYDFDAILRGDFLTPQPCKVFNRKLIYLFYGRPAYRAKDGNNFGGRDHTTVLHAVRKIGARLTTDAALREEIEALKCELQQA